MVHVWKLERAEWLRQCEHAYTAVVDQDIKGQGRIHKHEHWDTEDNHTKSNDVVEVGTSQSYQPAD